jgi:hypothetical protein
MLEIKCPYCGKRSQNEFSYGGDATVKRPTLGEEISTEDWDNLYILETTPEVNIQNYGITFLGVDNGLRLPEIPLLMKFLIHVK